MKQKRGPLEKGRLSDFAMFRISLGCHVSPLVNHLENFIVENLDRFSTPEKETMQ